MLATAIAAFLVAASPECLEPQFVPHDGAVRFNSTDLTVRGSDLAVKRSLTSSLTFRGQFGVGFGIPEEIAIVPLPGGAFQVIAPGPCPACSAAIPEPSPDAMARAVAAAARTLQASGASALAPEAQAYADALARDAAYRQSEWNARREAWLHVARQEPADGLERLPEMARYRVVRLRSGYIRFASPSAVQEFDAQGRLAREVTAGGLTFEILRDQQGLITRMRDGKGRFIAFDLDPSGRIVRATGSDGASSSYRYDGTGHLLAVEFGEERVIYTWDRDDRVVRQGRGDCASDVTYEPASLGGRVTSLATCGDVRERYEYAGGRGGFVRSVTVYAMDDDTPPHPAGPDTAGPRVMRRITYVEPLTSDGRRWTWQETVEEGDSVRQRIFDGDTFQPRFVAGNWSSATYEYDEFGHVTRKATDAEVVTVTHTEDGKVASVTRTATGARSGEQPETVRYTYDARRQLVHATGKGITVDASYDDRKRMSELRVSRGDERVRVTFAFDENDKPVRVQVDGKGEITIAYKADGEIDKVDSTGQGVSGAVTTAFKALSDLTSQAYVSVDAW